MAFLNFEQVIDFPNENAAVVNFGVEPDNTLTQFYIENKRQANEVVYKKYEGYDELNWEYVAQLLTAREIETLGIKSFMQLGTFGFYKTLYDQTCHILVPIFRDVERYQAPSLLMEDLGTEIKLTVFEPDNVKYDCFRISFRQGWFTEDYITYDKELIIPKPIATTVLLLGYIEEQVASPEVYYNYLF